MEYVLIGKIVNTFGIKGDLKIESYSDFEKERYAQGSFVYLGESHLKEEVKSFRKHKGFLLLVLKDKEDINLIEKYKGLNVYKAKEDIKPREKGKYYFSDLKGLQVMVDGKIIGSVKEVEEGVSSNYLRVSYQDKETLVPFIDSVFIEKVDLDNKLIVIKNMEGLF